MARTQLHQQRAPTLRRDISRRDMNGNDQSGATTLYEGNVEVMLSRSDWGLANATTKEIEVLTDVNSSSSKTNALLTCSRSRYGTSEQLKQLRDLLISRQQTIQRPRIRSTAGRYYFHISGSFPTIQ